MADDYDKATGDRTASFIPNFEVIFEGGVAQVRFDWGDSFSVSTGDDPEIFGHIAEWYDDDEACRVADAFAADLGVYVDAWNAKQRSYEAERIGQRLDAALPKLKAGVCECGKTMPCN